MILPLYEPIKKPLMQSRAMYLCGLKLVAN
jgi:hypothetical protein